MPRVEAVIFDVDGTLVDTSNWIMSAYEHALSHHKLPARSREEIASQVGKRLEDCYAFLAPGAEHEALIDVHRAFQTDNIGLIKPFEHCNDILEELHGLGKKLALFISRRRVLPSLEQAGIDVKLFDEVIDAIMVERGKPDPEGIELILGKLGLAAGSAVMVSDAAVDIIAGKAANGASTIGITHGFGTRIELESAQADYILGSLDALPAKIAAVERKA